VYNSKTKLVEEFVHVRFNNKKSDSNMSEQVESCAEIQVSKDAPLSTQEFEPIIEAPEPANPSEEPDTNAIPEANREVEDSKEEAHDDSEESA